MLASSFDPGGWQMVLDDISRYLDGAKTHLFGFDTNAGVHLGFMGSNHDPDFLKRYDAYYGDINPYPARTGLMKPGVVLSLDQIISETEIRRTEYFNDFMRTDENLTGGTGTSVDTRSTSMFILGTMHPHRYRDRLDQPARRLLEAITDDLGSMWELTRRISGHILEQGGLVDGLSAARILVVNPNGDPTYVSDSAARLIEDGGVVRTDPLGRIRFADDGLDRLERGLRNDLAREDRVLKMASAATPCGNWFVRLYPMARPARTPSATASFVLGLHGPNLLITIDPIPQLANRGLGHGVTRAEEEVAKLLSEGRTLAEIAELRQASIHTVRNQLKSAMSKLDVSTQSQLVARILRNE